MANGLIDHDKSECDACVDGAARDACGKLLPKKLHDEIS
jgi:hypothetical protein